LKGGNGLIQNHGATLSLESSHWKTGHLKEFAVDESEQWVARYKWRHTDDGYVFRRTSHKRVDGVVAGRICYLHRELMGLEYGDGWQVDHRNEDPSDNRFANLLVVTPREHLRGIQIARQRWQPVVRLDAFGDSEKTQTIYSRGDSGGLVDRT
jgi:hypothetical protein